MMARMNDVTIGLDPEAVELINRFVAAAATVKPYGDITDIQRIVVQPGEALVVRVPSDTPREEHSRIVAAFKFALPGVPVFVVRDGVEFLAIAQAATND
jgi:hypothetical protein